MDFSLFHLINAGVASRDWMEDPVTAAAAVAVPLFAVVTALLWFLARPFGATTWKRASVGALTSAGVALLTNQVISHLWQRPRPSAAHADATQLLAAASYDPSFPSDHAAAAFAIAFAVFACSRRVGAGFLVAATLVALSRIALGLHYPSDVLAGAAVGYGAAALVMQMGNAWLLRLVGLLSRVSDPLLEPLWRRLPHRGSSRA